MDIARMNAQGLRTKAIADKLMMNDLTVEKKRENIMGKWTLESIANVV